MTPTGRDGQRGRPGGAPAVVTEAELVAAWSKARHHIIVSQLAPTFLLAVSLVLFVLDVADQPLAVRLAMAGILLASGILGAVAQITAATEGLAVARALADLPATTALGRSIAGMRWAMTVVRIVTPAIFVAIFLAEVWALFVGRPI